VLRRSRPSLPQQRGQPNLPTLVRSSRQPQLANPYRFARHEAAQQVRKLCQLSDGIVCHSWHSPFIIHSNNRNNRRRSYSGSAGAAIKMLWDELQSSETNRLETYLSECPLLALSGQSSCARVCPLLDQSRQN